MQEYLERLPDAAGELNINKNNTGGASPSGNGSRCETQADSMVVPNALDSRDEKPDIKDVFIVGESRSSQAARSHVSGHPCSASSLQSPKFTAPYMHSDGEIRDIPLASSGTNLQFIGSGVSRSYSGDRSNLHAGHPELDVSVVQQPIKIEPQGKPFQVELMPSMLGFPGQAGPTDLNADRSTLCIRDTMGTLIPVQNERAQSQGFVNQHTYIHPPYPPPSAALRQDRKRIDFCCGRATHPRHFATVPAVLSPGVCQSAMGPEWLFHWRLSCL